MKKWIAAVSGAALIMLSGCETISGVDLNKVMSQQALIVSSESSQTISLDLLLDENAQVPAQTKVMLDLFSSVKLNLKSIKMQDREHLSLQGELVYTKGKIPFQLNMQERDYIIKVEGAKKPILIRNGGVPLEKSQEAMNEQIKQLTKKYTELMPQLVAFFTGNFPNPSRLIVTPVSDAVNGETMLLQKVHADINGTELTGLLKGLITNIMADEKGVRELIGQLYDATLLIIKEAMKNEGTGTKDDPASLVMMYIDNKTLAVEFAATSVKAFLTKTLSGLEEAAEETDDSASSEAMSHFLSDKQKLKIDMFVDKDGNTRKSAMELSISAPPGEDNGGVKGFELKSTAEMWNMNKPVTMDVINGSSGYVEVTDLSRPSKLLGALDKQSQLYKLLKDDMKVTKKDISLLMNESGVPNDGTRPYIKDSTTMVPVRFVVERLDADVDWDGETKQITVTDDLNGAKVIMKIGQKTAAINGQIVPLEVAPELINGTTFVPLRMIAQDGLKARIGWDEQTHTVLIQRD